MGWLAGLAGYVYFVYQEICRSTDIEFPKHFSGLLDEFISVWSEVFHALARAAGFTLEQTKEIPQKILSAVRTFTSNDPVPDSQIVTADAVSDEFTEYVPVNMDETLERLHKHVIKSQFLLLKDIVESLKFQPDQIRHLEINHITMSIITSVFLKYGLRARDESAELLQKLVFNNLKEGQKSGSGITRAAVEYDKRKTLYIEQFEKILHKPAISISDFDAVSKVLTGNIFIDKFGHNLNSMGRKVSDLIMRNFERHKEFVRSELVVPQARLDPES